MEFVNEHVTTQQTVFGTSRTCREKRRSRDENSLHVDRSIRKEQEIILDFDQSNVLLALSLIHI